MPTESRKETELAERIENYRMIDVPLMIGDWRRENDRRWGSDRV